MFIVGCIYWWYYIYDIIHENMNNFAAIVYMFKTQMDDVTTVLKR